MKTDLDIYNRKDLKKKLSELGLAMTKDRGQNFLLNKETLSKMLDAVNADGPVLEIGPGMGHFTRYLLKKYSPLTLVELDKGFAEYLERELEGDFTLNQKDFLKYSIPEIKEKPWVIAGNIPYNITGKIITKILKQGEKVSRFYLLMQKEAGEKLLEKPGSKEYGRLSVMVQHYCNAQILFKVGPESFYPAPRVDSVYMEFELKPGMQWDEDFFNWVNAIFTARRKTIWNVFKKKYDGEQFKSVLTKKGLEPSLRGESLNPEDLYALFEALRCWYK